MCDSDSEFEFVEIGMSSNIDKEIIKQYVIEYIKTTQGSTKTENEIAADMKNIADKIRTQYLAIGSNSTNEQPKTVINASIESPKSEIDPPKVVVEPAIEQPKVVVEPAIDSPKVVVEPAIEQPKVVVEPAIDPPKVVVEPAIEQPNTTCIGNPCTCPIFVLDFNNNTSTSFSKTVYNTEPLRKAISDLVRHVTSDQHTDTHPASLSQSTREVKYINTIKIITYDKNAPVYIPCDTILKNSRLAHRLSETVAKNDEQIYTIDASYMSSLNVMEMLVAMTWTNNKISGDSTDIERYIKFLTQLEVNPSIGICIMDNMMQLNESATYYKHFVKLYKKEEYSKYFSKNSLLRHLASSAYFEDISVNTNNKNQTVVSFTI